MNEDELVLWHKKMASELATSLGIDQETATEIHLGAWERMEAWAHEPYPHEWMKTNKEKS